MIDPEPNRCRAIVWYGKWSMFQKRCARRASTMGTLTNRDGAQPCGFCWQHTPLIDGGTEQTTIKGAIPGSGGGHLVTGTWRKDPPA